MGFVDLLCQSRQHKQALEKSRPRLYRMAMAWCGEEMLADDLAQEALIRAIRKRHQLKDPEKLNAWLFSILANCWREHLRKQRPHVDLDEAPLVDWRSPEFEHQRNDVISRVRHEISRLPQGQRQTLTLVDIEGFSYAETADILDIPVGTVMSRLSRARGTLKERMHDLCEQQPQLKRVK